MDSSPNEAAQLSELIASNFRGRSNFIAYKNGAIFEPEPVESINPDWIATRHLAGKRDLGFYLLTEHEQIHCACIDIDNHGGENPLWREQSEAVYIALSKLGIESLVELSQSGEGAHVWIFFLYAIDAWLPRLFLLKFLESLKIIAEVFPKQIGFTGEKKLGNLVRYPLWNKSRFVQTDDEWNTLDPIATLRAIKKIDGMDLREIAFNAGFGEIQKPDYGTNGSEPVAWTDEDRKKARACVKKLGDDRWHVYDSWLRVGMALHNVFDDNEEGLKEWIAFSRRSKQKYKPGVCEKKWRSFAGDRDAALGLGSLIAWAREDSGEPGLPIAGTRGDEPDLSDNQLRAISEFNKTDDGNACVISYLYGDRLRYNHSSGVWLAWRGNRWKADEIQENRRLAVKAAKARFLAAAKVPGMINAERAALVKFSMMSERQDRIKAALEATERFDPISTTQEQWDCDDLQFGCGNGTVDLRTGDCLPPDPARLISRHTSVCFNSTSSCPRWEQFVSEIFSGDASMVDFIQRAVGYSMTGAVNEQCLFVLHGRGENGKSTFIEVLQAVFGEYGISTEFTAFVAQKKDAGGAREEIARLAGRRFVSAIEGDEGARLAEGLIKSLTGGDSVSARFLYGHTFEFKPKFKIWLATNHKPVIRGSDHAIWRRIRFVPFTRSFKDDPEKDLNLLSKLIDELQGVLQWCILGALKWKQVGLFAPKTVEDATKNYKSEMNPVENFISEKCVIGDLKSDSSMSLFQAYLDWAKQSGERELSHKSFSMKIEELGFMKKHTGIGRVFVGLERTQQ